MKGIDHDTVKPLLSSPLLSGQPLFGGSRKYCQLYTVIKTSIQHPPLLSGRSQLLGIPRVILFCFTTLLKSQEDLKSGVFCQTKVKECGNVIVSLAFVNVMDSIITIIVLLFLHLHLFVLIFDKLKTGPCPMLFSGEPLLNGHLY